MAKIIKLTETKAYRVEGVSIKGANYVSIRQLYKTKKKPEEWSIGYQGVTIPADASDRLIKAVKAITAEGKFKILEVKDDS